MKNQTNNFPPTAWPLLILELPRRLPTAFLVFREVRSIPESTTPGSGSALFPNGDNSLRKSLAP